MSKINITFNDEKDERKWFLSSGETWFYLSTEDMKDLIKLMKGHEALDWLSPF